jgi:hypothetical protein
MKPKINVKPDTKKATFILSQSLKSDNKMERNIEKK